MYVGMQYRFILINFFIYTLQLSKSIMLFLKISDSLEFVENTLFFCVCCVAKILLKH